MKLGAILFGAALALQIADAAVSSDTNDRPPFVVGGNETIPFKYTSWMVGIFRPDRNRTFCGGSYIGKNIVLTASRK